MSFTNKQLDALRKSIQEVQVPFPRKEGEPQHPRLIIHGPDEVIISAEEGDGVADFYGEMVREYRGDDGEIHNAFGIHDCLHKWANKYDLFLEWQNGGCISVWPN